MGLLGGQGPLCPGFWWVELLFGCIGEGLGLDLLALEAVGGWFLPSLGFLEQVSSG